MKVVGQSILRADAREKVTGQTLYIDDLQFPGMLHARVLRSPHAHAFIKAIDVAAAFYSINDGWMEFSNIYRK